MKPLQKRVIVNGLMNFLSGAAALLVILPLVLVFGFLVYQGGSSLNLAFFTQMPKPAFPRS